MTKQELEDKARWIRQTVLQQAIAGGKAHFGGTFSCVEILTFLYYHRLRIDRNNAKSLNRDRFLLGKGHACQAIYAIFKDFGWLSQERFDSYGKDGGLGGQLDTYIAGVEWNTGSLGHALGVGAGLALAAKLDKKDWKAYVLLGDAELQEGATWEAIMFAGEHALTNLVCIVDRNRLSATRTIGTFKSGLSDLQLKMELSDWDCFLVDGHSFEELEFAFATEAEERPKMVIADTIKGKGVSFMENAMHWHHGMPDSELLELAKKELGV